MTDREFDQLAKKAFVHDLGVSEPLWDRSRPRRRPWPSLFEMGAAFACGCLVLAILAKPTPPRRVPSEVVKLIQAPVETTYDSVTTLPGQPPGLMTAISLRRVQ